MPRSRNPVARPEPTYSWTDISDEEDESSEVERSDSSHDNGSRGAESNQERVDSEDEADAGEDFAPTKKARSSKALPEGKVQAKRGRRAGKLRAMANLPADILFMIAEHLDPVSLLYLGRANKYLRSLFASRKNSQAVWKIVKRSIALPDLERTDINDLALTSLIYDRDCFICGKKRAMLVDYSLAMRWCKGCRSKNLATADSLERMIHLLSPNTIRCLLLTYQGPLKKKAHGEGYYHIAEAIKINTDLLDLEDSITAARGSKEQEQSARAKYEQYISQREALVLAAYSDGLNLRVWEESTLADRRKATEDARRARENAVMAKLRDLGYEQRDLHSMWQIEHLVSQPAALTPSIWRRISPKVIAHVEYNKQERLAEEARIRAQEQQRHWTQPYYEAVWTWTGSGWSWSCVQFFR
ncbi:hypothetical protein JCM16303_006868 [Sporobolomyces ruberrimus]